MSRRSREELRDLMIEAGCELLHRRGLAFDPPSLTYANVFQHLKATQGVHLHRSQVHGRIWKSQDHYRSEVVAETIRTVLPGSDEVDELVAELTRTSGIADLQTLIKSWASAALGVQQLGGDKDLGFDILLASQALTHRSSATSSAVVEAATTNLGARMLRNEQRYDSVAAMFDLDFAADLDMDRNDAVKLLARSTSALVEGSQLIDNLDLNGRAEFNTVDGQGNEEAIDAVTLGLVVLVEQLFDLQS